MTLYVSGATATIRRYRERFRDVLGCLIVPGAKNAAAAIAGLGLPMAADNGAFSGLDVDAFESMLRSYSGIALEWVVAPDVVADNAATETLWPGWATKIEAAGFRPAFVLQDGATVATVRKIDPPAVFVGGSTDWKLGPEARAIVKWAKGRGLPAHMGRVNTQKRIRYAIEIGCDSADGSGFSKWPDARIPKAVRWIRKELQPGLI